LDRLSLANENVYQSIDIHEEGRLGHEGVQDRWRNRDEQEENIMCDFGSRQGMKRRSIRIKTVTEIPANKVVDSAVKYRIGAK
jgi:hypothetical protein